MSYYRFSMAQVTDPPQSRHPLLIPPPFTLYYPCSTSQVCDNFLDPVTGVPVNFNFLPTFATSKLGVFPHTVQGNVTLPYPPYVYPSYYLLLPPHPLSPLLSFPMISVCTGRSHSWRLRQPELPLLLLLTLPLPSPFLIIPYHSL